MIIRYLFIILLFCSCVSSEGAINQLDKPIDTSKIIFLNYNISKNPDELVVIKFIDKIIVEGKLKATSSTDFNPGEGAIKLIQMDSKHQSLDSISIENPLSKTVEFVNESGQFEKRTINLERAEFSVRMQLNSKTKFISIYGHDNPNKPLIQHKL